jgi:catechol 2,3-dioxygenase-like lactoylglutathione lyase family enzyme
MKWNHTGIKTTNLEKSIHFYCDILGFRKLEEVVILNKKYIFVGNDTVKIEDCITSASRWTISKKPPLTSAKKKSSSCCRFRNSCQTGR